MPEESEKPTDQQRPTWFALVCVWLCLIAIVALGLVMLTVIVWFIDINSGVWIGKIGLPAAMIALSLAGVLSVARLETGRQHFAPRFIVRLACGFDSLFNSFKL